MPENKVSIRVLEKIGLHYWEERITEGKTELIYRKQIS